MKSPEMRNYFPAADFFSNNARALLVAILFRSPSHSHGFSMHPPTSTLRDTAEALLLQVLRASNIGFEENTAHGRLSFIFLGFDWTSDSHRWLFSGMRKLYQRAPTCRLSVSSTSLL